MLLFHCSYLFIYLFVMYISLGKRKALYSKVHSKRSIYVVTGIVKWLSCSFAPFQCLFHPFSLCQMEIFQFQLELMLIFLACPPIGCLKIQRMQLAFPAYGQPRIRLPHVLQASLSLLVGSKFSALELPLLHHGCDHRLSLNMSPRGQALSMSYQQNKGVVPLAERNKSRFMFLF